MIPFAARLTLLLLAGLASPAVTAEPAVIPGGDIPGAAAPVAQPAPSPAVKGAQYVRRTVEIPMRDGVRLHTVIILPPKARNVPLVLDRTPYGAEKATASGGGSTPEAILSPILAELVRAGYGVVVQDVRGKHASGGDYVMNRPLAGPLNPTGIDHSTDAFDSIDWLVKNVPETSGKVATFGISYDGWTALMSLVDPHPALKAVIPINPMVDVWKGDDWFHNGAFRQVMATYFHDQTRARDSAVRWNAPSGDQYEALLAAGSAAAFGRSLGIDANPAWQRLLRHPDYDDYWKGQAVDRILAQSGISVPTLIVGGFWDQEDVYGAPSLFTALKDDPDASLVIGPWYHGQMVGSAFQYGPLHFGVDTGRWFREQVMLPFLDQHLKGKPDRVSKVTVYQAQANRWQRLDAWPTACKADCPAPLTPLFLAPGAAVSFAEPVGQAFQSFVSDPANPVPYRARPVLSPWARGSTWRNWLGDDQRFLAGRTDVLSFTGAPLAAPVTLQGRPLVHLVAATSGSDSDWIVKLVDVFPSPNPERPELSGYHFPIAMEVMRGRYRNDPARPEAIPANAPQTYEFTLPDVNYVVKPGHRLMVQVQSSWFPLYDRNPQTFVPRIFDAQPNDYRAATQRVFTGPGGSWVGLPVVHGDPSTANR